MIRLLHVQQQYVQTMFQWLFNLTYFSHGACYCGFKVIPNVTPDTTLVGHLAFSVPTLFTGMVMLTSFDSAVQ